MGFDRGIFVKRLNHILGLIRTLNTVYKEEPENLSLNDINELTKIIETQLVDTIDYVKTN